MSLTLPEAFKRSNIVENWVVLLGYNKSLKTTGASNKLNEDLDRTETGVNVDTGSAFTAGDFIRVSTERMKIVSINSNTLTVIRSVNGVSITHDTDDQIFHDNFTPISFSDTQFEGEYSRGVIISEPSIRESIDIVKCTAKTGNVSVKIANFKYKGLNFSEELFNGDRDYVNRICQIYIKPSSGTLRADNLLVYTGRLVDFNHDQESVTLSIEARTPWDEVEIPQVKTNRGNYYPVAYGNYTPNGTSVTFSSGADIDDYRKRVSLYPIPVERQKGLTLFALSGDWSQSADAYPHFYEKATDALVPLANHASTITTVDAANETYEDGKAVRFHQNLVRSSLIKADEMTGISNASPFTWANNQNATDGDLLNADTSQRCVISGNFANNAKGTVKFSMPSLIGFPLLLQINFSFTCTITLGSSSGSGEIRVQLIDESFGNNQILGYWAFTGNATNNSTFVKTAGGNNDTSNLFYFDNPYSTSSNMLADGDGFGGDLELSLKCIQQSNNLGGELTGTLELFDIGIKANTAIDFSETTKAGKSIAGKTVSDIEFVYSGGDGLPDNGWNSGSAITEIHEAHRDLLERFTDFRDHENLNYGASRHPINWSSGTNVNSIKDWKIRYWVNEPKELNKILNELQYNGGFLGRYNGQGDYQYIFVPDSITTDFTLTKKDISRISISLTSFKKVTTSIDIEYEKHPATNKYAEKVEATNSASITSYDIESNEKKSKVRLNALVTAPAATPATNPNDDWYTYQNNLTGEVKHLVTLTLVNPIYFGLDVGDFLAFDDIGVNPFGGSWTDRDFIAVSVTRKRGLLTIKAREV